MPDPIILALSRQVHLGVLPQLLPEPDPLDLPRHLHRRGQGVQGARGRVP